MSYIGNSINQQFMYLWFCFRKYSTYHTDICNIAHLVTKSR